MKTIGMIGGLSWESTQEYYRLINKEVNKRLGYAHSASIRLYSFDFEEILELNRNGHDKELGKRLAAEALKLESAGVGVLLLCANTAHEWAKKIKKKTNVPLLHIADATGNAIRQAGLQKVLLLGTKYTMERDFIKGKLTKKYGIEVVIPSKDDREEVSRIIYDELVRGKIKDESRYYLLDVIKRHPQVNGIILGCTELPLIVKTEDCDVPLFNTTKLHAIAAVNFALE